MMISHTRFIENVTYPNIIIIFVFVISVIVHIFFQKVVILIVEVILVVKVVVIHRGMVTILVSISLLLCLLRGRPDCEPVDAEDEEDDQDDEDGRALPRLSLTLQRLCQSFTGHRKSCQRFLVVSESEIV